MMSIKVTASITIVMLGFIVFQSYLLGNTQEQLGKSNMALSVSEAKIKAYADASKAINEVKAAIQASRIERSKQYAAYNKRVMEELSDVKQHECFTNRSAIPVEYIRVLNNQGNDESSNRE